jgi:nucleoside 2-deoxyribosyltransferase
MLSMDATKLKVNMHPNNHVNSNRTWQIEANCMLFTNETKLKTKHAYEQVRIKANLAS